MRQLTASPWFSRPVGCLMALAFMVWADPLARAQVHDNANIFSREAIQEAEQTISQLQTKHRHSLLVETYSAIPDSMQDEFTQKGKQPFFQDWVDQRAAAERINGVVVLICMNPAHLQIWVGNETQKKLFTLADREALQNHLKEFLHDKKYDDALTKTANFVLKRMDERDPGNTGATSALDTYSTPNPPTAAQPNPPAAGQPNYHYTYSSPPRSTSWGTSAISTFVCLFIGVIILIVVLRLVFRGSGGGYGGGYGGGGYGGGPNYPPQGGYGPGYGGGYGPGYAPQQRSGFGSGFLGGLLGGAVGGYAADRLMNRNEGNFSAPGGGGISSAPPDSGGTFTPDTGGSSSGADFGSSDSGGGGGADFGSSDSGSGGADFGGGGGGDSGSSGGSDF